MNFSVSSAQQNACLNHTDMLNATHLLLLMLSNQTTSSEQEQWIFEYYCLLCIRRTKTFPKLSLFLLLNTATSLPQYGMFRITLMWQLSSPISIDKRQQGMFISTAYHFSHMYVTLVYCHQGNTPLVSHFSALVLSKYNPLDSYLS